ncbi:PREDICTED: putative small intestine sodium-dependent phosphate transport protein-like [Elephantulus edwardii]|uniref:putative small intestine sodium-dependent phosphate transport protein-like n=1 Tax=Elephantulus edwardii TaxID=28737 RepID=UPI0003F098EA|nr:PREDICTED: putative small intestine sodium-dependent phosphate transport protein-like [Elephantulus edwardii]
MSLGIAIPAMVNYTALHSHLNASTKMPSASSQGYWNETLKELKALAPVYDWSPEIQGIILSSMNYGSFLAPIPTGYVSGVFGAKYVVGSGLLISSVLALFIPLAADTGVTVLLVVRVIQGIAQVLVTTGEYSILVKWAPPMERSQLNSVAMSGVTLGSFTVFAAGGLLCQILGWPYIFYIFGGIGCACCLLWFSLVYEDPMHHPFISISEKKYIQCALAQENYSPGWSLPIMAMIKSLPLWSLLISFFSYGWTFFILMTFTPTYISSVLETNLRDSGILSSLPSVFASIFTILGGLFADFLISRKFLRLITVRKLFTAVGILIPSMLLVSLYWLRSNVRTAVTFLVLNSAFNSLCFSGVLVNLLDIAPRYAGVLTGLSQVFGYAAGALSPTATGFLLSQDSELGWRNIFLLSASINILSLIIYLIFGKADVQDWAKEEQTPTSKQTE